MPVVTVQPLVPALAGEVLALFDRAFPDNPVWSGCCCLYYHVPESPRDSSPAVRERHRAMMAERIEAGLQRGFLATVDGSGVGWLNAGAREGYANPRGYVGDADVWAMCFVVDPAWRGRGVGTALLAGRSRRSARRGCRPSRRFRGRSLLRTPPLARSPRLRTRGRSRPT